ncbi:MAG: FeoA family protein [Candidatus Eremiobacterota bacterium]
MRLLSQLQPDESGHILSLGGPPHMTRRLISIGLRPGAGVRLVRRGPLGGPIQVALGSNFISLRDQEAEQVRLEQG